MDASLFRVWVYLSASPLTWLTATVVAYVAGVALYESAGRGAWLHPLLVCIPVLIGLLLVTDTRYEDYFAGAQFVHFLLGPATVALAVPLYRQRGVLKKYWLPILASILLGAVMAIVSVVGVAAIGGASAATLASLAPKSVTTPVAMAIATEIGGLPSLTAGVVSVTGILGAAFGPRILDLCGVRDAHARGIAIGVAAHGIGTARAFEEDSTTGSFAGLAMVLCALATAVLLPPVWLLLF